jgi:hypothetical protein
MTSPPAERRDVPELLLTIAEGQPEIKPKAKGELEA